MPRWRRRLPRGESALRTPGEVAGRAANVGSLLNSPPASRDNLLSGKGMIPPSSIGQATPNLGSLTIDIADITP